MEAHACITPQAEQSAATTLDCKATLAQLRRLAPAKVPARCTLPILSAVCLEGIDGVDGPELWARRTDLDCTASVRIAGNADGWPTATCVDGAALQSALDGRSTARLEVDAARVYVIRNDGAHSTIPVMAPDDFPPAPGRGVAVCSIDPDALRYALRHTAAAASDDETRPELCGVLLERVGIRGRGPCLRLTATNGHRLHWVDVDAVGFEPGQDAPLTLALLPERFCHKLSVGKVLSSDAVTVRASASFCTLVQNGASFATRLLQGPFPPYRVVIPRDPTPRFEFDAVPSLALLESAYSASDPFTRQVRLSARDGAMILEAYGPEDAPRFSAALPGQLIDGADYLAGFNAGYLVDAVRLFGMARIRLSQDSATHAAMLTPADGAAGDRAALVMPLRLPDVDHSHR